MSPDDTARRLPTNGPHETLHPPARAGGQDELGTLFRQARQAQGLELKDVAELTHVRRDYLKALEEGRYSDLPEDVYTRNFVRLFAQAVGVPADRALEVYQRERQRAGGLSTLEERLEKERRGEPPGQPRRRGGGGFQLNPAVPTLLLVVALVALAVWGYNSLFFRGVPAPQPAEAGTAAPTPAPQAGSQPSGGLAAPIGGAGAPDGQAEGGSAGTAAQPVGGTVLLDVITDPPGARVSVDGFVLPGVTPIRAAPVTARAGRTLEVTLDGYRTVEQRFDLTESRTVELDLTAVAAGPEAESTASVPVGATEIVIAIKATSWLEVYRGSARNEGERLVYTTAAPGQTYRFTLPVYVHAGNAAGVEVTLGDGVPFAMGSSGAVVGRAFQAQ